MLDREGEMGGVAERAHWCDIEQYHADPGGTSTVYY